MSRRALSWLFVTSLVAGLVLMLGFDHPLTRVLGVASLFAFVVAGLFLIADEEFLAGDR
ncbi:MAG: hypothetical protein QOD83_4452 [Solirubrobacteraceae bacterium]|nr:hypothetical protein [Solirubrobacteraceae bacterium]